MTYYPSSSLSAQDFASFNDKLENKFSQLAIQYFCLDGPLLSETQPVQEDSIVSRYFSYNHWHHHEAHTEVSWSPSHSSCLLLRTCETTPQICTAASSALLHPAQTSYLHLTVQLNWMHHLPCLLSPPAVVVLCQSLDYKLLGAGSCLPLCMDTNK